MFFTKTVDQVMQKFTDVVNELDAIVKQEMEKQVDLKDEINELEAKRIESEKEQRRAHTIGSKLRAIVGG